MRTQQPVLALLIDGWDSEDNWGSAMAAAFAVCDVAGAAGAPGVWDALEYSPGMGETHNLHVLAHALDEESDAPIRYDAMILAAAYLSGEVRDDDLLLAARILSRYIDACRAAGLAY